MFYFPLLDEIVEYFKGLWSMGLTYCIWIVLCGLLIGFGIGLGNIKVVVVGVSLWLAGGVIYGISLEGKDKDDNN